MSDGKFGDFTPVVRVQLQRADMVERVGTDPVLSGCGLARALGSQLQGALKKGIARRYPDKVVIFQQDNLGGSLYLVLSGEVRLYSRRGKEVVELPAAHSGDVVGELEVLDGISTRRSAAAAQGVTELLELPREALLLSGRLPDPTRAYLEQVKKARSASAEDLAGFLDRW